MSQRPHPLRAAASAQSTAPVVAGGGATALLLGALVTGGNLDATQLDPVSIALAVAIVIINVVSPIVAARGTARAGEQNVTPLDAPQDDDGTPLVRREGPLIADALEHVLDQLQVLRAQAIARPVAGTPVTSTRAMPMVSRPVDQVRHDQALYDPASYDPGPEAPPARDPASTRLPPIRRSTGRHSVIEGR